MKMKKQSFTLLEVIIALALFAILSLLCVTLISQMTTSLEVQTKRSKHVESLVSLDKSLKKMFTNMVQYSWRDEDNQKLPHFAGFSDSVRFAHLNRVNNVSDGGLRFVDLYLDEEGRFIARYQTRPYRNAEELNENAYVSVLSENVAEIAFEYASVIEDQQSSEELEWLQEWEEDRLDIPLALMVTLTWNDETQETFLWRTAGNSYYERWGAWRNGESIQR